MNANFSQRCKGWAAGRLVVMGLLAGVGLGAYSAGAPADDEPALDTYARAGWIADIPLGGHQVRGMAMIVDEVTIQVDHFYYDGTAPAVYFYLGETNTNSAFANGLRVGPQLNRAYNDESLTLTLPAGSTLDGYGAISVWCEAFSVNFSSAAFVPPLCAGDANCDGAVTWRDIDYFVAAIGDDVAGWEALFAPNTPACPFENNDVNGDATVSWRDIDGLVALMNTACP